MLPSKSDITVILPAYNEADSIGGVIDGIRRYSNARIIIGDNNCSDDTASIATRRNCDVVRVAQQGKGATIRKLIGEVDTEYVIMSDADGTYPVGSCISYLRLLLEQVDTVIGQRKWMVGDAMSAVHRLGNIGLSVMASVLYLHPVTDLCSGLWGFRTDVLKSFKLTSNGFGLEAELLANVIRGGYSLVYVPIPYFPRVGKGKSKLKVATGITIAKQLLVSRFSRRR